jgi:hypothetical protein
VKLHKIYEQWKTGRSSLIHDFHQMEGDQRAAKLLLTLQPWEGHQMSNSHISNIDRRWILTGTCVRMIRAITCFHISAPTQPQAGSRGLRSSHSSLSLALPSSMASWGPICLHSTLLGSRTSSLTNQIITNRCRPWLRSTVRPYGGSST